MKEKLQKSSRYQDFLFSETNRQVDNNSNHFKRLLKSMEKYGFLPAYPIHVQSRGSRFEIVDGQHRYEAAKTLGLPVYFVIYNNGELNIPEINAGQGAWSLMDYLKSYAQQGYADYAELVEFSLKYKIPTTIAARLLQGCIGSDGTKQSNSLKDGNFKVKSRTTAESVASAVVAVRDINKHVGGHNLFITAISRCMAVKDFDVNVFVEKCRKCPGKLIVHPNLIAFNRMIDEIYNYQSKRPIPLEFLTNEAMKQRNPFKRGIESYQKQ